VGVCVYVRVNPCLLFSSVQQVCFPSSLEPMLTRYTYLCIYVYVCVCVCVHVYVYVCVCIFIHTARER